MKTWTKSLPVAPCLAGLLTALATGSCSGPAGVRPLQGDQVVLRNCAIDQNMLQGKSHIIVEAAACPELKLIGQPLHVSEDQHLSISQAENLRIDGALSVSGRLDLNRTRISGPGRIDLGSADRAPAFVRMTETVIGADATGTAPAVTFFGSANADCSKSMSANYEFSATAIEASADNAINLFNLPTSLAGLAFGSGDTAPLTIRLGDVCIPAGQDYALNAGNITYEAGNMKVLGRLNLPGSRLVLTGSDGLIIDGGEIVSRGTKDAVAQIDFIPGTSVAGRRVTLKNKANGSLAHTHINSGSILVSGSDLVISDSKIAGACSDSTDEDCRKPENRAAVTVSDGGSVDLSGSELLPKGETQILVKDDGEHRPQVTTSGEADDYKVATMDGRPFHVSRVLPLLVGTHISKKLRQTLSDLAGTYESPCMSSELNEENSFRRVFTFDNEIVVLGEGSPFFVPVRLRFVRTIVNYEGAGCDSPAYTSHMAGTATYYILRGEPDDAGTVPESLANRVHYDFGQLVWIYHNPNVIQTLNDQNFCEINTWQVNVPQDVTHKKCFGDGFRFHGYHDRFEVRPDGHLHLALDFDDRPDDLKELIPAAVNKSTIYTRKQ